MRVSALAPVIGVDGRRVTPLNGRSGGAWAPEGNAELRDSLQKQEAGPALRSETFGAYREQSVCDE
jgi:hypothetical protein